MKIRVSDYKEILDYLVEQRWAGNEIVAFLDDSAAVNKDELAFFDTAYDAKEYCYEMSTDIDFYSSLGIRSAYRVMSEALQDDSLLIKNSGLIDVGAMVQAKYQRIEYENNSNQNNKVMIIEKNLEFLRDQIRNAGFGESLEYKLREKMEQNSDKFELGFNKEYGKNKVEATLNFKKGDQGDLYFFNTYDLKLFKDNSETAIQQSFFNNNNRNTITLKEAYNLLDGRSVNKDMISQDKKEYNVWMRLDFKEIDERGNFKIKQFGEKYGYDLEEALQKHPIKELKDEQYKNDLMDSLKKGNIQSATFIKGEIEVKQYIEANPQFKSINLYDSNMQRLDGRQSQTQRQSEGVKESNGKENEKNHEEKEAKGKHRGQRV